MDDVHRYRPGSWFAVIGGSATAVLAPTERERALALWGVVDDDLDVDGALDVLVRDGLSGLSGFALLDTGPAGFRAVVRGDVRVRVDSTVGTDLLTGTGVGTWSDRWMDGVTTVTVETGDETPGGRELAVDRGLVRVSQLRLGTPAAPTPPPLPGDHGTIARLVLPTGDVVDVDRSVLVGRAPEPRRFDPDEQPRLVTVPSPGNEVSSTHLEVRPGTAGAAVLAVDLGSTNGTTVHRAGRSAEALPPGVPVALGPDDVLDLGDGVTLRVTAG